MIRALGVRALRLSVVAFGALTLALVLSGQAPRPNAASPIRVDGHVVDANGQPLSGVNVALRPIDVLVLPTTNVPQTTTDALGHFEFTVREPGSYILFATKQGFGQQQYGASAPGGLGAVIPLQSGSAVRDLLVRMARAGTLTGRVVDRDGAARPSTQVRLYRRHYLRDHKTLMPVRYGVATDRQGAFTLSDLAPGEYYLKAAPGTQDRRNGSDQEIPTYYPSAANAATAAPIWISPGIDVRGIEVELKRGPLYTIQGRVLSRESKNPVAGVRLYLSSEETLASGESPLSATSRSPDGYFEIKCVPPGSYRLRSIPNSRRNTNEAPKPESGEITLSITRQDLGNVEFLVGSGANIQGRVTVDGKAPPPLPADSPTQLPAGVRITGVRLGPRLVMSLSDADAAETVSPPMAEQGSNSPVIAPIAPDGTFILDRIGPARYLFAITLPSPELYVASIRFGSRDLTRSPLDMTSGIGGRLEIHLSRGAGRVTGTVRDSNGKPAPGTIVTLWPDIPDRGTATYGIQRARADYNGTFQFTSLRPEQYRLAAWAEDITGILENPDFLKTFTSRAVSIAVRDGSRLTANVTPIPVEEISQAIQRF